MKPQMETDRLQKPSLDFQETAANWYAALLPTAYSPHSANSVRNSLAKLVHDATDLLYCSNYDSNTAEGIGASLADLGYVQGDALGISIKALTEAWLPGSSAANQPILRMTDIFADLANGYFKAAAKTVLDHQEAVREAQLVTLRELHQNLENQRNLHRLTAERLQTLHDVESGILAAQSAEAIAEVAIDHIMRIIPCDTATVSTVEFSRDVLEVLASRNTPLQQGDLIPLSYTTKERLQALANKESLVVNDVGAEVNSAKGLGYIHKRGINSVMNVPLLIADQLIGLLSLESRELGTFSSHHDAIARQVADSVAVAIHNRMLLETERIARRESETLRDVAARISSNLESESLLDYILEQLARVLPYDSAVILLTIGNSRTISASRGFMPMHIESLNDLDELPANIRKLLSSQKPVLIADTLLDPDWVVLPGSEYVRCWLGVPLLSHGQPIGMLAVDKSEPYFYEQSSADLAFAFANPAAIAIENARLYQEVQRHAETLEKQIAERTRDLSLLYEIAAITGRHMNIRSALEESLEEIVDDLGFSAGAVHTLDLASEVLTLVAFHNLENSHSEKIEHIDAQSRLSVRVLSSQVPLVAADIQQNQDVAGTPVPEFASHYVGVPMRARGETIGILSLFGAPSRPFSPNVAILLTSVANHMAVAVGNADLRRQAEQLAVIRERELLARDLHDSATQSLFSLTLFAAAASEKARSGQIEHTLQYLDDIRDTADQTHREMRLLLYELGSSDRGEIRLEEALRQRLRIVEGRSGIDASLHAYYDTSLTSKLERALYYIANEALNNALKHSGATKLDLEIRDVEGQINLFISDDGVGFDLQAAQNGPGQGLINMQKRVEALGGQLSILTTAGNGTRILASMPRKQQAYL